MYADEDMFTARSEVRGEVGRIELAGRFDFNGRRQMREAYDPLLEDEQVRVLEIGLAGVEFIDSSALGMLLLLRDRAEETARKVVLCEPRGTVEQMLAVANFNRLFEIRS